MHNFFLKKHYGSLISSIFCMVISLGCLSTIITACKKDEPKNSALTFTMSFSEEEITLEEGKNKSISDLLVIEPKSVADTLTVVYSSSNKKVATVNASGRVKALFEGRTVITASAHGKTAEINVRVKPVKIKEFTVPDGTVEASINVPLELEIGITPENASPGHLEVTVSSDDAQIKFEDNVWKFKTDIIGLYTITVSYGETTKTFTVQAKVIEVESVILNKSSAMVEIGKTLTLTAEVSPANATDPTIVWTSSDPTVATVTNGVCRGLKKGQTTITATTSNGKKATCTLKVTDEDLSHVHLFSVGNGKQVLFSPGNLQYTTTGTHLTADGSTPYPGTFRFAPTQYSMIGTNNWMIASDYTGWIDLFGSGTAGGAARALPWTHSTNNTDYTYINNWMFDWGQFNEIQRGTETDAAGQWRTPSMEEFDFLLNTRPRAANLYGVARVNGVCGLILLPDDWTATAGVTFKAGTSATVEDEPTSANYASVNDFTASQWEALEADGAVFLPAAGRRHGTSMEDTFRGIYWTATQYDALMKNKALQIQPHLIFFWSEEWCEGCSVRLVRDF